MNSYEPPQHDSDWKTQQPSATSPQKNSAYGLVSTAKLHRFKKAADNGLPSIRCSQESSGITPLPTDIYFKTSMLHMKGPHDLSDLILQENGHQSNLPSLTLSENHHSCIEPSQQQRHQQPKHTLYTLHVPRAPKMIDAPPKLGGTQAHDYADTHAHKLPHNIQKALTQMLQKKIHAEGVYTEERLVQLFTSIYYSNNTLDRRALVAYIEDMAKAFVINDPLRLIRARNLEHGLDIYERDLAEAELQPGNMSDESISRAANKLLLRKLNHSSTPSSIKPKENWLPLRVSAKKSAGKHQLAKPTMPLSLPSLPTNVCGSDSDSHTQEKHPSMRATKDTNVVSSLPFLTPPAHTSSSSNEQQLHFDHDSTLKVSTLQTPVAPLNMQQSNDSHNSQRSLQEQFQLILEQQTIQQAQQQAQIQLLQQQLFLQQEMQQQQLLEHQMYNYELRRQDYLNYIHNYRQVEPYPRYAPVPVSSIQAARSVTSIPPRTSGIGVYGLPTNPIRSPTTKMRNSRRVFSPERIAVSRQQQIVYECRSRAQELADVLLSKKENTEKIQDIVNIDWQHFTYESACNQVPNEHALSSTRAQAAKVSPKTAQRIPQISEIDMRTLDRAVQNTTVEDLPSTPVLLSSIKPKRMGTPPLYREGITSIVSCNDDIMDPNLIQEHTKGQMLYQLSRRQYKSREHNGGTDSQDVDIAVDSVVLDDMHNTNNGSLLPPLR